MCTSLLSSGRQKRLSMFLWTVMCPENETSWKYRRMACLRSCAATNCALCFRVTSALQSRMESHFLHPLTLPEITYVTGFCMAKNRMECWRFPYTMERFSYVPRMWCPFALFVSIHLERRGLLGFPRWWLQYLWISGQAFLLLNLTTGMASERYLWMTKRGQHC